MTNTGFNHEADSMTEAFCAPFTIDEVTEELKELTGESFYLHHVNTYTRTLCKIMFDKYEVVDEKRQQRLATLLAFLVTSFLLSQLDDFTSPISLLIYTGEHEIVKEIKERFPGILSYSLNHLTGPESFIVSCLAEEFEDSVKGLNPIDKGITLGIMLLMISP